MLLFRSEKHVGRWCAGRGVPRRPTVFPHQLWQLALVWYENRLTVESRRPDAAEMVEVFKTLGLEGPFWDPNSDQWESIPGII
jgi:hypothetical protein